MIPTAITKRRLAIIKEMHLHGINHSRKKFIADYIHAVLDYDYCVEMLLKTVIIDSGGMLGRMRFPDLIGKVREMYPSIRYLSEIQDLHKARNAVQHGGIVPSDHDIQRFGMSLRLFIDEILTICYDNNIEYDNISLSQLIPSIIESLILKYMEDSLNKNNNSDAYTYARELINYHKLLLRKNMKLPYTRSNTNFGFDFEDPIDRIVSWTEDAHKKIEWLIDRIIMQEYYTDVHKILEYYNKLQFRREIKTLNESEEVRTFAYNFILGTQRFIEDSDLDEPYIFDIKVTEKRKHGCLLEIGYASIHDITNATLEIRRSIVSVIKEIDLPLENGLHEVKIEDTTLEEVDSIWVMISNSYNQSRAVFSL